MSVRHGYSTMGGIEYGGCGEDKKKEIISHQLGISTGYGDARQSLLTHIDIHLWASP